MRQAPGSPRKRKIDDSINPEISALEVEKIWQKTKLSGPLPDPEANALVAGVMNAHRVQGKATPSTPAAINAIKTLLKDGCVDLLGADAPEFRRLLTRLEPMAKAYHQAAMNNWQPVAVCVVWSVASGVIEELGGNGGTTRHSVAVRFTAAALLRMGWNGIGAPGIEALLKKKPRVQS